MKMKMWIFLAILVLAVSVLAAEEKTIAMTTTEWPPFASDKLGPGGLFYEIATQTFKAMGYKVEIVLYPYLRCVQYAKDGNTTKNNNRYVGYLCDYYSPDIEKDFYFSEVFLTSPLGFVQKKDSGIKYDKILDLKKYKIGIVDGYVNTDEFDSLVVAKQLKTETVAEDVINLKKVNGGRLDMAVIDKNVLDYLLSSDKDAMSFKNNLEFNSKILEDKKIYACFARNPDGEQALKIFNEGLKKIDVKKIQKEYCEKLAAKK